MFKLLIEAFSEEEFWKDKFGVLLYIIWYALGFVCSCILVFTDSIIATIFGIFGIIMYGFLEGYFWDILEEL